MSVFPERQISRSDPHEDPAEPLVSHIIELRSRLIWSLLFWAAGTTLCYGASGGLLDWLARRAGGVVFTMPAEAFLIRLKAAAFLGFLAALPLILHQAWLFVARALSPALRRLAFALAAASYGLGNFLQAVEDARRALAVNPNDKTAHALMKLSAGRSAAARSSHAPPPATRKSPTSSSSSPPRRSSPPARAPSWTRCCVSRAGGTPPRAFPAGTRGFPWKSWSPPGRT